MKLNHLNLIVTDVPAATAFFETYFGFKCTSVKGNGAVAVLSGTDGFTLVLMNGKEAPVYPHSFHIGFMLDHPDEITALYGRLKDDGIAVGQEPKKIRDGFGFYFHFDSLMIEVGKADK